MSTELNIDMASLETLAYYDGPLLVSFDCKQSQDLKYMAICTDDQPDYSQWHILELDLLLYKKIVSTIKEEAVPMIKAFTNARRIWEVRNPNDAWFLTSDNEIKGTRVNFEEIDKSCLPIGDVTLVYFES